MTDRDAVRRGYDALAEGYRRDRDPPADERAILDRFVGDLDPDDRVLDAGCGPGEPVLRQLTGASRAVGLDLSATQLGLARGAVPAAPLVQGDLTSLPFAADRFDAVVSTHALIHVPAGDHPAVLEEFARVLRPGGRLLVSEGTSAWAGDNPDWLDSGVEMQWAILGPEATRDQLRAAGFDVVRESVSGDELSEDGTWTFFTAWLVELE